MLAEGDKNHTSQDLAEALNTNPVVIRRALAALQNAGIISSSKGPNGGSRLARSPKQISLADIYRATETGSLFHLPESLETKQRGSSGVLRGVLKKAQAAFEDNLDETSLSQLVKKAAKKAGRK